MVERSSEALSIVLVDDDPQVLRSIRRLLEHAGHRVRTATSAAAALKMQISSDDVLITDRVMPRVGGVELLAKLRELAPDLRALLISGHGRGSMESMPGVGFLEKPFEADELIKELALLS